MAQIIVFVSNPVTQKQSNIVKAIDERFPPKVDSLHGTDLQYLKKNYKNNHRFFFVSEFLSMCASKDLTYLAPDFALVFPDDEEISEKDWICMSRHMETWFFPSITPTPLTINAARLMQPPQVLKPKTMINNGEEKLELPEKVEERYFDEYDITLAKVETPKLPENYDLKTHYLEDEDILLIEVEKPFCDVPYTVVLRDFEKKGSDLTQFFTDIFICSSWGVSRYDYEFLNQVWNHWNMSGELDLQNRLKEATERCYPREGEQPNAEPEVYRRFMSQVEESIKSKNSRKFEDEWNEQRLKRRREEDLLLN